MNRLLPVFIVLLLTLAACQHRADAPPAANAPFNPDKRSNTVAWLSPHDSVLAVLPAFRQRVLQQLQAIEAGPSLFITHRVQGQTLQFRVAEIENDTLLQWFGDPETWDDSLRPLLKYRFLNNYRCGGFQPGFKGDCIGDPFGGGSVMVTIFPYHFCVPCKDSFCFEGLTQIGTKEVFLDRECTHPFVTVPITEWTCR